MVKVDIISGFLGAGKTTLIKKLIKEAFQNEKLVLIENEFGEIGIDGGFLKEAGIQITEMNSGCICCSLVGDFGTALKEVVRQYAPERIVIEPSGVGKLSDVIKAVQNVAEESGLEMNSFTTIVDAKKCRVYMKNFGEFFTNQVEYAKTVVLSRSQNVTPEKLAECEHMLSALNPQATLITTPWDQLTGAKILESMEADHSMEEELLEAAKGCPECGHVHEDEEHHHHEQEHEGGCGCDGHAEHGHHHDHKNCGCHEGHDHHEHDHDCCCHNDHHHHADEVFESWGAQTSQVYNADDIRKRLNELNDVDLYGTILRAKGMINGGNAEWIYFDFVPGEFEVRSGEPDVTGKLCVIGSGLNKPAIQALFHLEKEV